LSKDLLAAGRKIFLTGRFHAHLGDDLIQPAADRPVGFARFPFHLLDIAAVADKALEEFQALRGEAKEWRKLEFADNACAAGSAVELRYDKWGGTTGAGLGDKWHLGYSNKASLANILLFVNIFWQKLNYFDLLSIYLIAACGHPSGRVGIFPPL
jgi:hypothetical protein